MLGGDGGTTIAPKAESSPRGISAGVVEAKHACEKRPIGKHLTRKWNALFGHRERPPTTHSEPRSTTSRNFRARVRSTMPPAWRLRDRTQGQPRRVLNCNVALMHVESTWPSRDGLRRPRASSYARGHTRRLLAHSRLSRSIETPALSPSPDPQSRVSKRYTTSL